MSIDRRVRDSLQRVGDVTDLDVETHLERTVRRADRRASGLPVGQVLAAAMVVVLVVVGVRVLDLARSAGVGATPSPSPTAIDSRSVVAGTYAVTLPPEVPDPDGLTLAGRWTLTLGRDGTLDIEAPAGFTGSRAVGHAYSVTGDGFETDLWFNDLCDSVGRYGYTRDGPRLTLTVVDDSCATRVAVLSSAVWSIVP